MPSMYQVFEKGVSKLLEAADGQGECFGIDIGILFNFAFTLFNSPFHRENRPEKQNGTKKRRTCKGQS